MDHRLAPVYERMSLSFDSSKEAVFDVEFLPARKCDAQGGTVSAQLPTRAIPITMMPDMSRKQRKRKRGSRRKKRRLIDSMDGAALSEPVTSGSEWQLEEAIAREGK
jgi:hypothetical protein